MNFGKDFLCLFGIFVLFDVTYGLHPFKSNSTTLIIADSKVYLETHSKFIDYLTSIQYEVRFELFHENKEYGKYDEYDFDNLIWMAPTSKSLRKTTVIKKITEFIDTKGKNLFIFGDVHAETLTRSLINEFGVDINKPGTRLEDESILKNLVPSTASAKEELLSDISIIASDNFLNSPAITTLSDRSKSILYKGIGLRRDKENPRVIPILESHKSTYSIFQDGGLNNSPNNFLLVAAHQTLYNNRVLVTGSLDMCSDYMIQLSVENSEVFGNQKFCEDLVMWNFGESGIVKYENIRHHKLSESSEMIPENYKITDEMEYSVDLYEWKKDHWEALVEKNLQLHFIMLDPYIIANLEQRKEGSPNYFVQMKIPDKLGVFHFKIFYDKPGYNYLEISTKIPVRQPRHDELPRYQEAAYPYYGGVFLTMIGFLIFSIAFIYTKENPVTPQTKKTE